MMASAMDVFKAELKRQLLSLLSDDEQESRSLQDEDTLTPTFAPTQAPLTEPNDWEVLRGTLIIFGGLFLVCSLLFCWFKVKYPKTYNIRSWAPKVKTDLADDHYGHFDWIWKIMKFSDDDLREQCGLDALVFLRTFDVGFKVSLVGCFISLFLMPLYGTAEESEETAHINDPISQISVSNVPPESKRFIASAVACYILFGYTMFLILKELDWFTKQRHAWLSARKAHNYAVYITHIPEELQSSYKLLEYFQNCFNDADVLEARVALNIPNLERKVKERDSVVLKLEHAINVQNIKGETPMVKRPKPPRNAITVYAEQLEILNREIPAEIAVLELSNSPYEASPRDRDVEGEDDYKRAAASKTGIDTAVQSTVSSANEKSVSRKSSNLSSSDAADEDSSNRKTLSKKTSDVLSNMGSTMTNMASVLLTNEEGTVKQSGFVTFKSLTTRQAALQMLHHPTPFAMSVSEAPELQYVSWPNVGASHKSLQLGRLISFILTFVLCVFWTIPMAFVASLTSVEGLSKEVDFLGDWIENAPWLADLIAILAPLALLAVDEVMKILLQIFSMLELPVSSTLLNNSLFVKMAIFRIIQTFFVQAISGSVLSEMSNLINNPTSVVDLLATSLPGQSTYFLQILLVKTSIGLSVELLRCGQLAIATERKIAGWMGLAYHLSQKERDTPIFGFCRPLCDPRPFLMADIFSNSVLYYLVLFVYSTMAPIVNWFLAVCFLLLSVGYRNQFVYNYPIFDGGGHMFIFFIYIVQVCMVIAQLTMLGFLALKKSYIAVPMMIPLLIVTFLFNRYVYQQHYHVLKYLPSGECIEKDREYSKDGPIDTSFLKDEYLQPALRAKEEMHAENMGVEEEIEHTGAQYVTPPGSEADMEETPEDKDVRSSEASENVASPEGPLT